MAFHDFFSNQQVSQSTKKASKKWLHIKPVWGFAEPHRQFEATRNPQHLRLELLRLDVFGMCLHRHYCDCQPTVAGRVFGYPKGGGWRCGGGCGLHGLHIPKSRGANFGGYDRPTHKKNAWSQVYFISNGWFRGISVAMSLKKKTLAASGAPQISWSMPWDAWANSSCFVTVKNKCLKSHRVWWFFVSKMLFLMMLEASWSFAAKFVGFEPQFVNVYWLLVEFGWLVSIWFVGWCRFIHNSKVSIPIGPIGQTL